jgi:uncharacterized membrane protein
LFIVPLVATAYFIFIAFSWLDSLLKLPYPGLGFLIILCAITIFGYLTTNFAFKAFTTWFDHGMNRIPLVKLIYSSLKDLLNAFVGDKKKFNKPVLVLMNEENKLYQIGFNTGGFIGAGVERYGFRLPATLVCRIWMALHCAEEQNYTTEYIRTYSNEIYSIRRYKWI